MSPADTARGGILIDRAPGADRVLTATRVVAVVIVPFLEKLFGFEGVELKFTDAGVKAIAQQALKRRTGARGLRGVIETSMLDIMFDIPSKTNVKEVLIDENVIEKGAPPKLTYKTEEEMRADDIKKSGAESA